MHPDLTPPPPLIWRALLDLSLTEDIGSGDVTSSLVIESEAKGRARVEARQDLITCGLFIAAEVFHRVDADLSVESLRGEGETVAAGDSLLVVEGPMRAILAAERTALNFLGRLCGIATLTRHYVDTVAGTGCQIVDTRKTLPGWRALDKFAVLAGGGVNHRFALYDGILLKDNHVAAGGGIEATVRRAIARAPAGLRVQVEVESLADAEIACDAGADFLLLDNCSPDLVRSIVERVGERALLEASGGITLRNLRAFAEAGVHRVSLGVLTHSAPSADVALEVEDGQGAR